MATQQGVIQGFMKSLDTTTKKGETALDAAIKAGSSSNFSSFQDVKTSMINDCTNANKNGEDFLKIYCGIDLDNDDTGAITGWDAGGSTVKTKNSIVPESGSLDTSFKSDSFTVNGLNVKLGKRTSSLEESLKVTTRSFSDLSSQEVYLWRSTYTWWIKNGLNLISESYGDNFSFLKDKSSTDVNKPTTKTMYVVFDNMGKDGSLATTWGGPSNSQKSTNDIKIQINMHYYGNLSGADGKPIDNKQKYLDRTLAHELTHAVMRANIDYYSELPALIKEGMADLTHGIDDTRTTSIKTLASNSTLLEKTLVLDKKAISISGVKNPSYAGGYMLLRYFARQAGDLTIDNKTDSLVKTFKGNDNIKNYFSKASITSGAGNDTIYNYGDTATIDSGTGNDRVRNGDISSVKIYGNNVSIASGAGNDTIYNYGDTVTIDSGTGNDSVINGSSSYVKIDGNTGNDFLFNDSVSSNVTMIGGTGNDTIWNWGANVTISGGKGNDEISNAASTGVNVLFSYATGDGNDLIKGFNTTSTLSIDNGKGSYSSITNNGDYIVTVGDGKITLVGAESLSKVNILGKNNDSTAKTYTNSDSSKVTLGSGIKVGDASTRTKAIKITGNTLNNTILGGSGKNSLYGANGNDYLAGGKSNDRLYGQNGADTLWGGKGNDTLSGGNGDDLFVYTAGNDVIADYAEGDMISISAAISKTSVKGADATFTIGSNTLTVKDSFGEEIVFIDANGKERTVIGGAYLANNSSSAKSTLSAWREVGDASERTKAIKLTGNENDNTLLGGTGKDSLYGADGDDYLSGGKGNDKLYGQNGDDTLWGGIGNDTLKGGDGADVFIYNSGEGKDVITDFANDDLLQITGTFSGSYNKSAKTVAFKVGSTASAITLKNFTATTFNINDDAYKISGSTLVKK